MVGVRKFFSLLVTETRELVTKAAASMEHEEGVQQENIPRELMQYRQWVCWRTVDRGPGKKPDKRPINPKTLHNAGVHWPNTWTNFEYAYLTYLSHRSKLRGIGFVLTPEDPIVGVDVDSCVQQGEIQADARRVVDHLQSYTEVSPSGTGLRILLACPGFGQNVRRPEVEVYSHSRFVTITGNHVEGTPLSLAEVGEEHLQALYGDLAEVREVQVVASPAAPEPGRPADAVPGSDLWERIFAEDRYGAQHRQRFAGNLSLDRHDHSLTVIRLLNCLARWTGGDPAQMRALMFMSPLANDKWLSKRRDGDWLDHQIADAIAFTQGSR